MKINYKKIPSTSVKFEPDVADTVEKSRKYANKEIWFAGINSNENCLESNLTEYNVYDICLLPKLYSEGFEVCAKEILDSAMENDMVVDVFIKICSFKSSEREFTPRELNNFEKVSTMFGASSRAVYVKVNQQGEYTIMLNDVSHGYTIEDIPLEINTCGYSPWEDEALYQAIAEQYGTSMNINIAPKPKPGMIEGINMNNAVKITKKDTEKVLLTIVNAERGIV